MSVFEAAQDISMADYSSWGDGERIVINVATLYREFSGGQPVTDIRADLFGMMAKLRKTLRN